MSVRNMRAVRADVTRNESNSPPRRFGFTLIELLVVMGVIIILTAIIAAVTPTLVRRQKVPDGASRLQGWLLIAKQRSLRDRVPTGLRIVLENRTQTTSPVNVPNPGTPTSVIVNVVQTSGFTTQGYPWQMEVNMELVIGDDDSFSNAETVTITAVTPTTFTADFLRPHPANVWVRLLDFATELEYVSQPQDFAVRPGDQNHPNQEARNRRRIRITDGTTPAFYSPPNAPAGLIVANSFWWAELETLTNPPPELPDFSGGFPLHEALWPVRVSGGDYLELLGGGGLFAIERVYRDSNFPTLGVRFLKLVGSTAPSEAVPYTGNYRIIRSPRPLVGETALKLPNEVVIDLTRRRGLDPNPETGELEIIFQPSGGVGGRRSARNLALLWVRDITRGPLEGEPTLIAVHIRTGHIAAHPVDINGADPYSFTRDGKSSGL